MKTTQHDGSYNDESAIIFLRLMPLTPPTQPSPLSLYPLHRAEYCTPQKNKKVTMQHPVTAPAWTGRTVPVHLPRPVRLHSSRHSSTGSGHRAPRPDGSRPRRAGKPCHNIPHEGPTVAKIAADALEMAALMMTVKALATAVTDLSSTVTALQARQPRDRHCCVSGEIGYYTRTCHQQAMMRDRPSNQQHGWEF